MSISVKFYPFELQKKPELRKAKKTFILASISFDGNRILKSTRISIGNEKTSWEKCWNFDHTDDSDYFVKSNFKDSSKINGELSRIKNGLISFYEGEKASLKDVDKSIMEKRFKELIGLKIISKPTSQRKFIDDFIEWIEERKKRATIGELSFESLKKDGTTLNHLSNFESKKHIRLDYDSIDKNFYFDFVDYLRRDRQLRDNSIGAIIKTIKTFMNQKLNEGLHKNQKFRDFKVLKEEPEPITLEIDELEAIEKLEFPKNSFLDKVKNLFLLQTYLCLRIGDLMALKPDNFDLKNRKIVKLVSGKSNFKYPDIPISDDIMKILENYPDLNIPKLSKPVYNRGIKDLCKKAGIDKIVKVEARYGNQIVQTSYQKYEKITSHSARRTGATLMYKSGFDMLFIMKLTGHKNIKIFQRYVGISEDDIMTTFQHGFNRDKLRKI